LKAIKLTARKVEKERVTVVNNEMNERCSDGLSSGIVVLRIRPWSRLDKKNDFDTDEIFSEKVSN